MTNLTLKIEKNYLTIINKYLSLEIVMVKLHINQIETKFWQKELARIS